MKNYLFLRSQDTVAVAIILKAPNFLIMNATTITILEVMKGNLMNY